MMPPYQGLDRIDLARVGPDLRLEVEVETVALDRLFQVGKKDHLLRVVVVNVRLVQPEAGAG